MNAAASAPAARTSVAAATVAGSVAVMPSNWDWTSLPRAATARDTIAKERMPEVSKLGPFGEQTGERPDKQRGGDDKDEGEGHLQRDDVFAQADTAEAGSGALAEQTDQAAAAGVEGGSKAAQKAGGEAGEDREASRRRLRVPRRALAAPSCGRNAIRARMASGATATPRMPPARARRTRSARSCRPMRPREAPRARRVPISRPLAEPGRERGRRRSGRRGQAARRWRRTGARAAGRGFGATANGPGERR